jgi:GH15 family glucan-1,4-alpha-glucosidase
MSRRAEDYALLGNGKTVALLGYDGSIDWLCWPRFDDDACFATIEKIRRELSEDGVVRRRKRRPGGPSEGAFWLAPAGWRTACRVRKNPAHGGESV